MIKREIRATKNRYLIIGFSWPVPKKPSKYCISPLITIEQRILLYKLLHYIKQVLRFRTESEKSAEADIG